MTAQINIAHGISGRFKLEVAKADTPEDTKVVADWFDNLITNKGLDNIGQTTAESKIAYSVVGTGTTTPTFSDSTLTTYLARSNDIYTSTMSAQTTTLPYYTVSTMKTEYPAGRATGNLTEIGMAGSLSGNAAVATLFSHALIVDSSGNPTTITILADEILYVTYELRIYPPDGGSDVTGSFTMDINGTTTNYTYTSRPAEFANGNYWNTATLFGHLPLTATGGQYGNGFCSDATALSNINSQPTGSGFVRWSSATTATYTSGDLYIDETFYMGVNAANFTIPMLVASNTFSSLIQVLIDPPVVKTNTEKFQVTFRFSWGRYTP